MALNDTSYNVTVAFDNKDRFWKTRYSFFSSCYGWINKLLTSFNRAEFLRENVDDPYDIVHLHDQTNDYNNFHNKGPTGSAIQVSFNDKVSANKIFKSLSIEGTQNIDGNPGIFVVNSDNLPDKQFSIGLVKDKGGILYMDLGQSQKNSSANVKCIGVINSISPIGTDHPLYDDILENDGSNIGKYFDFGITPLDLGASSKAKIVNGFYNGSLYFVQRITTYPNGLQSLQYVGDYGGITSGKLASSWGEIVNDQNNTGSYTFDMQDPTIDIPNYYNGSKILKMRSTVASNSVPTIYNTATTLNPEVYMLYQVSMNNIYGDDPRGQYCELIVSLGNKKFELYALNLNYEMTNLDHSS